MKTYLWQITAKTNLHVGNENNTSYGIIDKAVQRDVLTGLPCINSSSLKGAINEYCCKGDRVSPEDRLAIFGCDKYGDKSEAKKGKAIFYDAHILFLPVQDDKDDKNLFTYATSGAVLKHMQNRLELFGIKNLNPNVFNSGYNKNWQRDDFSSLCSDENLPIIARNVLKNGQSENLWYEQVIPAETVFYAVIQVPSDSDVLKKAMDKKIIQIGANATIGYGYCKFELKAEKDENEGKK